MSKPIICKSCKGRLTGFITTKRKRVSADTTINNHSASCPARRTISKETTT